jgi:signal transduction histidine kinase
MIARGESLISILEVSCLVIDELSGNLLSSILLLDPNSNRLRHAAAPNLPKGYCEAIDGVAIGPSAGSCGTAAYRSEEIVVSDIATDPLWADYRDLALAHGLRSCWSIPIVSLEGKKVLGTFAVYRREPYSPSSEDRDIIDRITHLVSVTLERNRATEALRTAQVELAHATRVMTMGEMTASIAHEVNQPLTAVITNGNACLRWLAGGTPNLDEAREAVRHIIRDGNRASAVIARIRSLSRKTVAEEKVRLDLNETIQEVMALVLSEVRRHRVAVRTELAGDLPSVLGDEVEIQQLLLNLIMNGIEAMSSVEDRPRELVISTQSDGADQVRVTVQDSGIGLDPQNMDRIFDAFYTTKRGGLGMGLAICRSIVENHGGRLWAVPNSGPGVTFQFTLLKYS